MFASMRSRHHALVPRRKKEEWQKKKKKKSPSAESAPICKELSVNLYPTIYT